MINYVIGIGAIIIVILLFRNLIKKEREKIAVVLVVAMDVHQQINVTINNNF